MHAIILAAGVGERLGAVSKNRPKCLLEFGGVTLLERHLHILRYCGIGRVTIVTGYQAAMIEASLCSKDYHLKLDSRYNPDFRDGSVVSLLAAGDILTAGESILLMDADVLYDHTLIRRLCDTRHANCFLLDRDFEAGEEPVKLCVRAQQLIDFRKCIDNDLHFDLQGESVGFFRFSAEEAAALATVAAQYIQTGHRNEPYEEVIRDRLLRAPAAFGYEDITGLPWIEIDFPADAERAEREILPQLTLPD